jgi:hypothetical protein
VSWSEQPIVCRFETESEFAEMKVYDEEQLKKKRRDDDDDELEDEDDVKQPLKKEVAAKVVGKEREIKVVEDFNLLDIPKKVNLKPLFEEFVIHMIPEGYEINFQPKRSSTYGTNVNNLNKKSCYTNRIYSIDDIVYQTRQPRALFANCKTKKILKVVKRRKLYDFEQHADTSSDEENDESMYSDHVVPMHKTNVYMFSKFMRDLEDLVDLAMPMLEKKISEMTSNLSMSADANDRKSNMVDRKDSSVSLTKTNSKSLLDDASDPGERIFVKKIMLIVEFNFPQKTPMHHRKRMRMRRRTRKILDSR